MAYVFKPFPKCKYHADGSVRVVNDAGEELALGPAWADTIASPVILETPLGASQSPSESPSPSEGASASPSAPVPPPKRRGRPPKVRP